MAGAVLRLHGDFVHARGFVAVLDGLVRHRQVLVDGPDAVAQIHLVLGAAGVALTAEGRGLKRSHVTQRANPLVLPAPDG